MAYRIVNRQGWYFTGSGWSPDAEDATVIERDMASEYVAFVRRESQQFVMLESIQACQ